MIYHVLRFKYKPETPPEKRAEIEEAARGFADFESTESIQFGRDLTGFDFGMVVLLRDIDAFERYMNDPLHFAADRLLFPWLADFQGFDFTDGDSDPEFQARFQAKSAEAQRPRQEMLRELAAGNT